MGKGKKRRKGEKGKKRGKRKKRGKKRGKERGKKRKSGEPAFNNNNPRRCRVVAALYTGARSFGEEKH